MSERLAIGTVRFLNAWPLAYGLAARPDVELYEEVPSRLPAMLAGGEVEAALVPSIEYFRLAASPHERARPTPCGRPTPTGYVVIDGPCVSSEGPVGSVRLFGYEKLGLVRRVLLDPASRTSNTLARLLVGRHWGIRAHFVLPEDVGPEPSRAPDAEVVIGDPGLVAERPEAQWERDLGEAWDEWIGRPFVYALWVARSDAPIERLTEMLMEARRRGLAAREELAARAAAVRAIPEEVALRHLVEQVRYDLTPAARAGLEKFYDLAVEEGIAGANVELRLIR